MQKQELKEITDFRITRGWKEFLETWQRATTTEEALGLLHMGANLEPFTLEEYKTLGGEKVEFCLKYADSKKEVIEYTEQDLNPVWGMNKIAFEREGWQQIVRKAYEVLVHRVLTKITSDIHDWKGTYLRPETIEKILKFLSCQENHQKKEPFQRDIREFLNTLYDYFTRPPQHHPFRELYTSRLRQELRLKVIKAMVAGEFYDELIKDRAYEAIPCLEMIIDPSGKAFYTYEGAKGAIEGAIRAGGPRRKAALALIDLEKLQKQEK